MHSSPIVAICFRCKGSDIVTDKARGDHVCRTCGEVVTSRVIDEQSEWISYAEDDRPRRDMSRSSGPTRESIWSDQTVFVGGSESQRDLLAKTQLLTEAPTKLKVARNIEEVYNLAARLNATLAATDCAEKIFTRAISENAYSQRDKRLLVAASVFLGCRQENCHRSLHQVAESSGTTLTQLSRLHSALSAALSLPTVHAPPVSLVPSITGRLGFSSAATELCRQVAVATTEFGCLEGSTAQSVAGVSVLLAAAALQLLRQRQQPQPSPPPPQPTTFLTTAMRLQYKGGGEFVRIALSSMSQLCHSSEATLLKGFHSVAHFAATAPLLPTRVLAEMSPDSLRMFCRSLELFYDQTNSHAIVTPENSLGDSSQGNGSKRTLFGMESSCDSKIEKRFKT